MKMPNRKRIPGYKPDLEGLKHYAQTAQQCVGDLRTMTRLGSRFNVTPNTARNALIVAGWEARPSMHGLRFWHPPNRPWPAPEEEDVV